MGMVEYKLAAVAAILCTGLAGGWMSLRLGGSSRNGPLLALGNALAGGVFLGAGLMHMLPDAGENMGAVTPGMDYPMAFLIAAVGFLAVLFLERVLFSGAHQQLEAAASGAAKVVSPFLLTLVLSLHSILAGVAFGVEDTVAGSLAIFIAIIAHKGSAAFALGVALKRGGLANGKLLAIIAMFSCMTPLGIGLGGVSNVLLEGTAAVGFEAVFDALAAGTFLYVAVLDIINEEFFETRQRRLKFAALCSGLGLMAALAVWL